MKLRVLVAFLDKQVGQVFETDHVGDQRFLLNAHHCEEVRVEPETAEARTPTRDATTRKRKPRGRAKPKPKPKAKRKPVAKSA